MSHSIQLDTLSIKPLNIRDKELPLTPESERFTALEFENETLVNEIRALRDQLETSAQEVKRYREVANAAKEFVKDVVAGAIQLQEATSAMQHIEKDARRKYVAYQQDLMRRRAERGGAI